MKIKTPEFSSITLYRKFQDEEESRAYMDHIFILEEVSQDDGRCLEGRVEQTYVSITPKFMRIISYFPSRIFQISDIRFMLEDMLHVPLGDFIVESLGIRVGVHAENMVKEYIKRIDSVCGYDRKLSSSMHASQTKRVWQMHYLLVKRPKLSFYKYGAVFNIITDDNVRKDKEEPNLTFELVWLKSPEWFKDIPVDDLDMDTYRITEICVRHLYDACMAIKKTGKRFSLNQAPAYIAFSYLLDEKFRQMYQYSYNRIY